MYHQFATNQVTRTSMSYYSNIPDDNVSGNGYMQLVIMRHLMMVMGEKFGEDYIDYL